MRKIELGILVAVIATFMAYNRPLPPTAPTAETTVHPSSPSTPLPNQTCPYVLAGPQDGLNLNQCACLFTEEKDFLRYHPGATATLKAGSVQIYSIHSGATEERTTVVGGRVVGVSVRGKGKEFDLTRDGLPAPGLGSTPATVLQSLQGQLIQQSSPTSIKTSGPNWTVFWHFGSDGLVDSIHLNGSEPGHRRHHRRHHFSPFHLPAPEQIMQGFENQNDLVVPKSLSTPVK